MGEALGNAASGQLLALMAFPACGAIFFAILVAYSLSKRKKDKIKLGTPPRKGSPSGQTMASNVEPVPDVDTSVLSHAAAGPKLNWPPAAPEPDKMEPVPPIEQPLAPANPPPAPEEKVDLAARLETHSPVVPAPTSPVELLRLLRQPESGQLVVEVAGQQFHKLADIPDKNIGQYILKLTANLLSFTNGMIETQAGIKSVFNPKLDTTPQPLTPAPQKLATTVSPPEPVQPERPPAEAPSIPKPPPEAQAAFLAAIQTQSTKPATPQPPSRRGLLGRTRPSAQPILLGLNLAEEINRIVQARLAISPLATNTKIEITSDPAGGIRIRVNGIPYASPEDVPDVEARELIKASIKQWERS